MQFAVMSNRKVAQTLPTSTVWHDDKVKGRPVTWALRNKVFSVALCTCFFLFALIVLVLHLLEDRDLSLLCRRSVEDTLQKAYSGAANFNRNSGSLEDSGKGVGISGGGEFGTQTRPKVLGLVGIQTGFDSALRRKVLRQTWFPSTSEGVFRLEEATGLAFRFVIGHTNDAGRMRALQEEVDEYKDFFRIDVDETYQKLNMKTLAYFRAAYMLFDADFYVKADDDIYLRPDRLATLLLKERPTPRTYLGCMKKGPVITDPNLKWYEPDGYMLGTEYFLHAYGPIYALSREVVAGLATSRNDSHRMFMNEDVTIGVWMLAMDVTHEDNRDLCDPECGPTSIAVWDLPRCSGLCNPTERMLELHQDETCAKSR